MGFHPPHLTKPPPQPKPHKRPLTAAELLADIRQRDPAYAATLTNMAVVTGVAGGPDYSKVTPPGRPPQPQPMTGVYGEC
jgi:hypothetical protein